MSMLTIRFTKIAVVPRIPVIILLAMILGLAMGVEPVWCTWHSRQAATRQVVSRNHLTNRSSDRDTRVSDCLIQCNTEIAVNVMMTVCATAAQELIIAAIQFDGIGISG